VFGTTQTYYVVDCGASGHNVRAQPNLKAMAVGKLKLGSCLLVTEQVSSAILFPPSLEPLHLIGNNRNIFMFALTGLDRLSLSLRKLHSSTSFIRIGFDVSSSFCVLVMTCHRLTGKSR